MDKNFHPFFRPEFRIETSIHFFSFFIKWIRNSGWIRLTVYKATCRFFLPVMGIFRNFFSKRLIFSIFSSDILRHFILSNPKTPKKFRMDKEQPKDFSSATAESNLAHEWDSTEIQLELELMRLLDLALISYFLIFIFVVG